MDKSIDYGALFGPEGTEAEGAGENEQTAAESAVTEDTTDTEGTEEETEEETADASGDAGEGGQSTGGKAQTPEENSRYAAARRKAEAERDLAVQKAREETREEMKRELEESIRALGLKSPSAKEPAAAMLAERAERAKLAEQAEQAERAKLAQRAMAERAMAEIERQIGEIRELDPSITSLADLKKMDSYGRFYELVKRGNTLTDAFRLVNMDRLTAKAGEAAKQAALNQVASKAHLDRTVTRGAGSVTVPADVIAEYRAFNPDAADAEIRAHWAKYKKA